jgi:hypothetical protein
MLLPEALVIDDEVQAHRHGIDDEAAKVGLLAMEQQVADQHVVEPEGAKVHPKDAQRRAPSALTLPPPARCSRKSLDPVEGGKPKQRDQIGMALDGAADNQKLRGVPDRKASLPPRTWTSTNASTVDKVTNVVTVSDQLFCSMASTDST